MAKILVKLIKYVDADVFIIKFVIEKHFSHYADKTT